MGRQAGVRTAGWQHPTSKRGHGDEGAGAQVYELEAQVLDAQQGFSQGLCERSSSSGAVDAVVEQLQAARAARRDWSGPGVAVGPPHPGSLSDIPGAPDLAGSYEAAGALHGSGEFASGGTDWEAGHQESEGHPCGEVHPLGYRSGEPREGDYHDGSQPADPDPDPGAEGAWRGAWGAQGSDGGLRYPQGGALAQAPPPPPIPRFDRRGTATGAEEASDPPGQGAGLDAHPGQGFAEAVEAALRESSALQARSSFPSHNSRSQRQHVC